MVNPSVYTLTLLFPCCSLKWSVVIGYGTTRMFLLLFFSWTKVRNLLSQFSWFRFLRLSTFLWSDDIVVLSFRFSVISMLSLALQIVLCRYYSLTIPTELTHRQSYPLGQYIRIVFNKSRYFKQIIASRIHYGAISKCEIESIASFCFGSMSLTKRRSYDWLLFLWDLFCLCWIPAIFQVFGGSITGTNQIRCYSSPSSLST